MSTASRKQKKVRNRRLDPEVRKNIILDKTAALIAKEGVSAVSMERVAREAGVSKPLVYVYFPNQKTLLRELLVRDQHRLIDMQTVAVEGATDFENYIRRTTKTYLKHIDETGDHIQRLMKEPSVAAVFEEFDRKDRQRVVEKLSQKVAETFDIPSKTAALATEIAMGMTGTAGDMLVRGVASRKRIEEITVALALGSVNAMSREFGRKNKKTAQKA